MLSRWIIVSMYCVVMMSLGANVASAQTYPNKPLRLYASAPGSTADLVARVVSQAMASSSGWSVIVDNRPSNALGDIIARAPSDGYSLVTTGNVTWVEPLLRKLSYDPLRDFSPITLATSAPQVLVVHPSVPVKSVKELIALAKARPGDLNYGSSGIGGTPHLAAELFKSLAGVNIVQVEYKGGGTSLAAVLSGETQLLFDSVSSSTPQIKAGKLRLLAVTSAQPSALFPGVPTVAASLPGYEVVSIIGLLAPAGTPQPIITRLNQEIVGVLNKPDVKEKFLNVGTEVVGSSPQEFAAKIKSETARWDKVIKSAGIRVE